jgi:site-specific DNA recombinase
MVRRVFDLYDELGNIRLVEERAGELGLRTRAQVLPSGLTRGGRPFTRGQIHYLLTNPTYRGLIRHKDKTYTGSHPAIISEDQWERVQTALLAARARPRRGVDNTMGDAGALLLGKLVDESGDRLTPSETKARGKSYRYYVSNRLLHGVADASGWRLPAEPLEEMLASHVAAHLARLADRHGILAVPDARQGANIVESVNRIAQHIKTGGRELLGALIQRGVITVGSISIEINRAALGHALNIATDAIAPEVLRLSVPFGLQRRGIETRIIAGPRDPTPDRTLLRALAESHRIATARLRGEPLGRHAVNQERASGSRERRKTWLAFLSPRIQMAILEGRHPEGLSLERILQSDMPLAWHDQERLFGFAAEIPAD